MTIAATNVQTSSLVWNSTLSESYTVPAGSNRVLIIVGTWENSASSAAPTVGGVAATELVQVVGTFGGVGIWAIKEAAIVSNSFEGVAKTVACATTWAIGQATMMTLTGVDQSAGYVLDTGAASDADYLGFSVTLNPTQADGYSVAGMQARVNEAVALSSGGWTTHSFYNATLTTLATYGRANAGSTENIAGSVSGGDGNQFYMVAGAAFKPAAGGSGIVPFNQRQGGGFVDLSGNLRG